MKRHRLNTVHEKFESLFPTWSERLTANRRSSESQGTALGKCAYGHGPVYRSMPAGVAQCRPAFVGGTVSTGAR